MDVLATLSRRPRSEGDWGSGLNHRVYYTNCHRSLNPWRDWEAWTQPAEPRVPEPPARVRTNTESCRNIFSKVSTGCVCSTFTRASCSWISSLKQTTRALDTQQDTHTHTHTDTHRHTHSSSSLVQSHQGRIKSLDKYNFTSDAEILTPDCVSVWVCECVCACAT